MTGDRSEEEERIIAESLSVCTKFVALKTKCRNVSSKRRKKAATLSVSKQQPLTKAPLHIYSDARTYIHTHTQTTSTHTYIAWRLITKNSKCNEPTTHEYCIFYNNNRKCVRRKMNFIWLECRHIQLRTQQYKTDIVSHTKNRNQVQIHQETLQWETCYTYQIICDVMRALEVKCL